MAEGMLVNVEVVHQTLRALKILRCNVTRIFQGLAEGVKSSNGEEGKEKAFILDLQQGLQNVNMCLKDLENATNNLVPLPGLPTLPNAGLLSQDPAQDRTSLYLQLMQSYKWTDKVREFAGHAVVLLNQNSLKRSILNTKRVRKVPQNSHNLATGIVDAQINSLDRRIFPEMHIEVNRPYGTSLVLQVTIGKTMKAIIILRSLITEWVVIKAYNEELLTEEGKIDIWTNSRYKVFQKVTDHANAAMLHYFAPSIADMALKSFMLWLHSYSTLFKAPCQRCGNYLHEFLPPTWRDFRTLDAYHEACR